MGENSIVVIDVMACYIVWLRYYVARYSYCVTRCSVYEWYGMVRYGKVPVRYGTVLYGTVRYGIVRQGRVGVVCLCMHISYLGHNLILKTRTKLHADVAGLEIFAALQEGGSSTTQLCSSRPSTFISSLTQISFFSSRHFYELIHTILQIFHPNTSSVAQFCSF